MEFEVSTRPRATWVWATDRDQAEALHAFLKASGCTVSAPQSGKAENRALDLDIGVVALEGLTSLRDAGHSFRWHPAQHPLGRTMLLCGIPVAGAE